MEILVTLHMLQYDLGNGLKRDQDLCIHFLCIDFVIFHHNFSYHIEIIANGRSIPNPKHTKPHAKDEKSHCKHLNRLLNRHLGSW